MDDFYIVSVYFSFSRSPCYLSLHFLFLQVECVRKANLNMQMLRLVEEQVCHSKDRNRSAWLPQRTVHASQNAVQHGPREVTAHVLDY